MRTVSVSVVLGVPCKFCGVRATIYCVLRRHDPAHGRELTTLRSALGEAQATISTIQATASRDAEAAPSGTWTDQMESQFEARLEAAVAEKTSELRGELAEAAAKLEAAERKVTMLTTRCICPESPPSFGRSSHCAAPVSQTDRAICLKICE